MVQSPSQEPEFCVQAPYEVAAARQLTEAAGHSPHTCALQRRATGELRATLPGQRPQGRYRQSTGMGVPVCMGIHV